MVTNDTERQEGNIRVKYVLRQGGNVKNPFLKRS